MQRSRICIIIYAAIPNLFQGMDSVCKNPKFLIETNIKKITISTEALIDDVNAGLAIKTGEMINGTVLSVNPETGIMEVNTIYGVVRINPDDLILEIVKLNLNSGEVIKGFALEETESIFSKFLKLKSSTIEKDTIKPRKGREVLQIYEKDC